MLCCLTLRASALPQAQLLTKDQLDFFESKIRPIFADNCYKCHSPSKGVPKAGLELDWKGGWQKGGGYGPVIVPGDPDKSELIQAVRYTDSNLQMPPDGKLSAEQVNDLVAWVRMGAPDPRTTRPAGDVVAYGGSGKNHWSFKPVTKPLPPAVKNQSWVKNDIDRFVLAKLEASGMSANEPADKRTLIRRAYFDLIGLPPTPVQVNAFLADNSPKCIRKSRRWPAGVAALRRTLGPALARRGAILGYQGAVRQAAAMRLRSIPMHGRIATTSSRRSMMICLTTSSSASSSPRTT